MTLTEEFERLLKYWYDEPEGKWFLEDFRKRLEHADQYMKEHNNG